MNLDTDIPLYAQPLDALDDLVLKQGSHDSLDEGACLMEAVAWFAGEPFSDSPKCADRSLAAFGRRLNDRLNDEERQLLKPLIPKLIGTAGSLALLKRRALLLVDRAVRVNLPAFLRELPRKPRPDLAAKFEALSPVIDRTSAERARDLAREVRAHIWESLTPAQRSYAAYAADAYADADAADDAYAYADAAAAAAYADAADDAYAYADAAAAAEWRALRRRTIERSIAAFTEAIELTEAS